MAHSTALWLLVCVFASITVVLGQTNSNTTTLPTTTTSTTNISSINTTDSVATEEEHEGTSPSWLLPVIVVSSALVTLLIVTVIAAVCCCLASRRSASTRTSRSSDQEIEPRQRKKPETPEKPDSELKSPQSLTKSGPLSEAPEEMFNDSKSESINKYKSKGSERNQIQTEPNTMVSNLNSSIETKAQRISYTPIHEGSFINKPSQYLPS